MDETGIVKVILQFMTSNQRECQKTIASKLFEKPTHDTSFLG
jgi:hypothetical protein